MCMYMRLFVYIRTHGLHYWLRFPFTFPFGFPCQFPLVVVFWQVSFSHLKPSTCLEHVSSPHYQSHNKLAFFAEGGGTYVYIINTREQ